MSDRKPAAGHLDELEIKVTLQGLELVIDSPEMRIDDLDSVRWCFEGIPSRWIPGIVFFDGDGVGIGPFESIDQNSESAVGRGNSGKPGTYSYMVVLRDGMGASLSTLFSEPANLSQGPPVVRVRVDLSANQFEVVPTVCKTAPGTPVRWDFEGLEPNCLAEIRFREVTRTGESTPTPEESYFGPFESFTYFEQAVEGSGLGVVGKHAYDVHVVAIDSGPRGMLLRSAQSEDPVIDNEEAVSGPPPEDDSEDRVVSG